MTCRANAIEREDGFLFMGWTKELDTKAGFYQIWHDADKTPDKRKKCFYSSVKQSVFKTKNS